MKSSKKMWLLMVVGVCIVFAQYHVMSNAWLVHPNTGVGVAGQPLYPDATPPPPPPPLPPLPPAQAAAHSEQLVRAAVQKLQLDNPLASIVGEKILRDLVLQVGRELVTLGGCGSLAALMATTEIPTPTMTPPPPPPPPTPPPLPPLPPLYVITPTYRRPEQIPELTRMGQTLMHVPNIHWLVIEDAVNRTSQVTELLKKIGIPFEHLTAPMPSFYKDKRGPKPRGVSNRNRGLQWLRKNATTGVFYFADDDNTYDIELFEQIRGTNRVSMWPVGLCTKFGLSSPIVVNGSFAGFYDGWVAGRKFPVDMAGFAVNVEFLLKRPKAAMPYRPGFEEDGFLKSLAPFEPRDVELKADNCTRILVWHTQTKHNEASAQLDSNKYNNTNLVLLKKQIV